MEPTTTQPTKEAYTATFNLFKGTDNHHPYFNQPFRQDGFYYATDAQSLIYLPAEVIVLDFHDQDRPVPAKIIPKTPTCNVEINVADLERQLVPDMIDETQEKDEENKCKECEGEGEVECDMGHMHECEECDGTGTITDSIEVTTGRQIVDPRKMFIMDGFGFQYKQLRRLVDACRLLGVETITKTNGARLTGNLFKCGAVGILVMPCYVGELGEEDAKPVVINIG